MRSSPGLLETLTNIQVTVKICKVYFPQFRWLVFSSLCLKNDIEGSIYVCYVIYNINWKAHVGMRRWNDEQQIIGFGMCKLIMFMTFWPVMKGLRRFKEIVCLFLSGLRIEQYFCVEILPPLLWWTLYVCVYRRGVFLCFKSSLLQ